MPAMNQGLYSFFLATEQASKCGSAVHKPSSIATVDMHCTVTTPSTSRQAIYLIVPDDNIPCVIIPVHLIYLKHSATPSHPCTPSSPKHTVYSSSSFSHSHNQGPAMPASRKISPGARHDHMPADGPLRYERYERYSTL
jgi:hypothetical protein